METVVMNYFKKLIQTLTKEKDVLESILKLENEKYEILRNVDIKGLMEINSQEEGLLEMIDTVEKKRKEIIFYLCKEYNLDRNLSLKEIVSILKEEIGEEIEKEISSLRENIKNVSENLKAAVRENEALIKSNLEIISLTLNLTGKHSFYETYNHKSKGDSFSKVHIVNSLA